MMVRFSRVGLAAAPMCHPSVVRSRQLMGHDEGNTLKSQDYREGLRALPLKAMECVFFYQLGLVALVWLCLMLQWAWPSDPAAVCPTVPEPPGPLPKRKREPTPFAGLTPKPPCDACEHRGDPHPQPPASPPPRIVPTR